MPIAAINDKVDAFEINGAEDMYTICPLPDFLKTLSVLVNRKYNLKFHFEYTLGEKDGVCIPLKCAVWHKEQLEWKYLAEIKCKESNKIEGIEMLISIAADILY